VGALAIADLVKTSLGPKGMDKILQSASRGGAVSVTNDGATILKSVLIDNPAAKVLIDISKVQDDEVGDGTTSVCVLAGEFLRQAAELIEKKMHPQVHLFKQTDSSKHSTGLCSTTSAPRGGHIKAQNERCGKAGVKAAARVGMRESKKRHGSVLNDRYPFSGFAHPRTTRKLGLTLIRSLTVALPPPPPPPRDCGGWLPSRSRCRRPAPHPYHPSFSLTHYRHGDAAGISAAPLR